jgi:hypothetical protein
MALLCRELNPEENTVLMPEGTELKFSLQVRVVPRPGYPRHNGAPTAMKPEAARPGLPRMDPNMVPTI